MKIIHLYILYKTIPMSKAKVTTIYKSGRVNDIYTKEINPCPSLEIGKTQKQTL